MAKRQAQALQPQQQEQQVVAYEAMFLLPPGAAMDQDGTGLRLCRSFIERHGGQVVVIKRWDERKLYYEINGQKRGTYVIAYFRAPGAAVGAIERDVKLSDEVLRVMVTKADHLNEDEMNAVEPQPIVREERPSWERDDRGGYRGGDRGPRGDDRGPREDRPRDDRPREDRPPRRREEAPAAEAGAGKE
jgi:small subunit ribosomal protein S6